MTSSRERPLLSLGVPSCLVAVVLLGTVFTSSGLAQDSFLWGGASTTEPLGAGGLYMLDPDTGTAELVGFPGITNGQGSMSLTGIDFHPQTGVLYAVVGGSGSGADLITINTTTGMGTLVGPIRGSGFDAANRDPRSGCGSLAFMPDGRLFAGCWEGGTPEGKIVEINPATGAVLAVNRTTNGELLTGLACSREGVLWGARGGNIDEGPAIIHTLDPDTGTITSTLALSDADAAVSSLAFAPDGTLYASLPLERTLATISTASGTVTDVGSYGATVARIAGLAATTHTFGDCGVSFDPRGASFRADGGSGETIFTLVENPATAPSSCPGSMDMLASDVDWITITDIDLVGSLIGMTGRMVKGPLEFSVDPLGGAGPRQGTISATVGLTSGGSIRTAFVVTQSAVEDDTHEVTGVFDAAGFQALISPGSIAAVGGLFTDITATAGSVPLPFNLDGFSVTFNNIEGAMFGVFDGAFDQANVQVPWNVDVSSGGVDVRVVWTKSKGNVVSNAFRANAARASPGIFEFPVGQAIVTNFSLGGDDVIQGSWAQPDGSVPDPNVVTQPAAIGGVITIWCNGLGPVTETPATGDIPRGDLPFTTKTVRVFIGGQLATIIGAPVLQPESVGLNQINAFVPDGVAPGNAVPIVIEVECDGQVFRSRADVTIAVRAAP